MELRVINSEAVKRLLSMPQAIEQMRSAFSALSSGQAIMPARSRVDLPKGDMLLMPACLPDSGLCVKMVSIYPGNRQCNLPVIQGAILVFDSETGEPKALMDCETLTAIRTGAGGGLAADMLARRNSQVVGLMGAGVQAEMQLRAAMAVRAIRKVVIFDPSHETVESLLAAIASEEGDLEIQLADDPSKAVRAADVVITATTSNTPTFDGHDLQPGTHVNAIGTYRPETRELDDVTMERGFVVVDSREAAMVEAGDLIIPGRSPDAELGEIVNGTAPGRTDDEQITVYKAVGLAVQDAAAASWVLEQAEQLGIGQMVEM